ncbi:hypothetical protein F0310_05160 (plasmid) [Borrelia sp. A-FGy1]|uniref:hypothetical protein n=1 Tax=Borrelia sp. A-FGy1 TaxID=2608247 RepID=UPI0015F3B2B6|nr:hypothetical protein [Borrelia sp. A-FGy1]QMU99807.1 hypothetical protein F0310_05160 [Borrelia sp. A-FGy1]
MVKDKDLNQQQDSTIKEGIKTLGTYAIKHQETSNVYIGSLLHNVSSILKFVNIKHPTINKIVDNSRLIDELISFTQDIYNSIIADSEAREQERYKEEMIDIINVAGQIVANSSNSKDKKELLEKLREKRNQLALEKIQALQKEIDDEEYF